MKFYSVEIEFGAENDAAAWLVRQTIAKALLAAGSLPEQPFHVRVRKQGYPVFGNTDDAIWGVDYFTAVERTGAGS